MSAFPRPQDAFAHRSSPERAQSAQGPRTSTNKTDLESNTPPSKKRTGRSSRKASQSPQRHSAWAAPLQSVLSGSEVSSVVSAEEGASVGGSRTASPLAQRAPAAPLSPPRSPRGSGEIPLPPEPRYNRRGEVAEVVSELPRRTEPEQQRPPIPPQSSMSPSRPVQEDNFSVSVSDAGTGSVSQAELEGHIASAVSNSLERSRAGQQRAYARGVKEAVAEARAESASRIADLEKSLESSKAEIQSLEKELGESSRKQSEIEAELKRSHDEVSELQRRIFEAENEWSERQKQAEVRLESARQSWQQELEAVKSATQQEWEQKLVESNRKLSEVETELAKSRRDFLDVEAKLDRLQRQLESAHSEKTNQLRQQLETTTSKLEELQRLYDSERQSSTSKLEELQRLYDSERQSSSLKLEEVKEHMAHQARDDKEKALNDLDREWRTRAADLADSHAQAAVAEAKAVWESERDPHADHEQVERSIHAAVEAAKTELREQIQELEQDNATLRTERDQARTERDQAEQQKERLAQKLESASSLPPPTPQKQQLEESSVYLPIAASLAGGALVGGALAVFLRKK